MTGLYTDPCHIEGIGLGIILREEKMVSSSSVDQQDMRVKVLLHIVFACKFAPNYNKVNTAMYAK